MKIIPITAFTDNYIWTICNADEGYFDCVDPGDAQPVFEYINQSSLKLRNIYLTHHHFDHIGGVEDLKNSYPYISVYGPSDPRISFNDILVKENDLLDCGHYKLKVIETPGHTSTHISYYEPNQHLLFCGDTLFSAGCGRVFDGTMHQLFKSLQKYKTLPDETEVYCAHEYTLNNLKFANTIENNTVANKCMEKLENFDTQCSLPSTLKLEMQINPFLRTSETAIKVFAKSHQIDSNNEFEVFKFLRELKDRF